MSNCNARLGYGTGNDVVNDYSGSADEVRLKAGINTSDVKLQRTGYDLYIELLDDNGAVSDSFKIKNQFQSIGYNYGVEKVTFADGTGWGANEFQAAIIRGWSGNDRLVGLHSVADVFDSDAGGNDTLNGRSGNDIYWLGYGTGNDVVVGEQIDSGDEVRLKAGINTSHVKLHRIGYDLYIDLLDTNGAVSDSLKIQYQFIINHSDTYGVEKVTFVDGTVWDTSDLQSVLLSSGQGSVGADIYDGSLDSVDGVMQGGRGSDVYLLGRNSGNDTIDEAAYNGNGGTDVDVVRLKSGLTASDVKLSKNRNDLIILVLSNDGTAKDSLTVKNYYVNDSAKIERVEFEDGTAWDANDFMLVRIKGTSRNDNLYGEGNLNDVFDSDVGGNDRLHGYGGDDVYWLGVGTGHDTIYEYYGNDGDAGDVIKIKDGIGTADVRLLRSDNGDHLHVQLLGAADTNGDRVVTDSLTVAYYYTNDSAKIERVEFEDGTAWDANDFMLVRIKGTSRNDNLYGEGNLNDVFDGDAGGNDTLYGYGGNDTYWLGAETGNDTIREYYSNTSGDAGDVLKVDTDVAFTSIRLSRTGNDLVIKIMDSDGTSSNSLRVERHYTDDTAKIEKITAGDKVLLSSQYTALIDEMSLFENGTSGFSSVEDIYEHYWQDADSITTPA